MLTPFKDIKGHIIMVGDKVSHIGPDDGVTYYGKIAQIKTEWSKEEQDELGLEPVTEDFFFVYDTPPDCQDDKPEVLLSVVIDEVGVSLIEPRCERA